MARRCRPSVCAAPSSARPCACTGGASRRRRGCTPGSTPPRAHSRPSTTARCSPACLDTGELAGYRTPRILSSADVTFAWNGLFHVEAAWAGDLLRARRGRARRRDAARQRCDLDEPGRRRAVPGRLLRARVRARGQPRAARGRRLRAARGADDVRVARGRGGQGRSHRRLPDRGRHHRHLRPRVALRRLPRPADRPLARHPRSRARPPLVGRYRSAGRVAGDARSRGARVHHVRRRRGDDARRRAGLLRRARRVLPARAAPRSPRRRATSARTASTSSRSRASIRARATSPAVR